MRERLKKVEWRIAADQARSGNGTEVQGDGREEAEAGVAAADKEVEDAGVEEERLQEVWSRMEAAARREVYYTLDG